MAYGQIRSSSGRVLNLSPEGWINNEGENLNDAPLQSNALMSAMQRPQAQAQQQAMQQPGANRLAQVAIAPDLGDFLEANGTSMKNMVDYNGKKAFRVADGYVWQNPDGSTGKATIQNPQQVVYAAQQRAAEKDRLAMDATRTQMEHTKAQTAALQQPGDKWELQKTDDGIVRVNKSLGVAEPVKMGGQSFGAPGAKMTEDQGKATGWLIQAENAFKNMTSAASQDASSTEPGVNDAIAAIPSFGLGEAVANQMRSAPRQQFLQGAASLSEALLRAATGAGVNAQEAAQKIKEITPSFGDAKSTIEQKMASIPLYIESLKVRAGPGSKKAEVVLNSQRERDIHAQADAILRGK